MRTIERCSDNDTEGPEATKWTTRHIETSKIGNATVGTPPNANYYSWKTIFKARAEDYALQPVIDGVAHPSMDEVLDFGVTITAAIQHADCAPNKFDIWWEALNCPIQAYVWNPDTVTGRHYDGVNQWLPNYPYYMGCRDGEHFEDPPYAPSDFPITATRWIPSRFGAVNYGNDSQEILFHSGLVFFLDIAGCGGGCTSPLAPNEELSGCVALHNLKVNYVNPVVNSLSRQFMPPVGGVPLILTGLAFDQSDAELSSTDRCSLNSAIAWASHVWKIYFIGLQGQGTTTLTRDAAPPNGFTVDSDTQITISAMPALANGTYEILLEKQNVNGIGIVEAYAGDWTCDAEGLCVPGTRRSFLVGEITDPPRPPLLTFKWRWIIDGLPVDKYYAPLDTRAPEIFWSGRVLGVSTLKRSIDSMTGMFSVSDMNVDLASNDKQFQMLLAQGHCKNQVVEIMHGWATEPVGWMRHMFHGIVDDYSLHGPTFKIMLKDVSRRHFRKTMPRLTITTAEYPSAHDNAIGQGMPDLVGLHSLTTGSAPGSIEALCVNTAARKYIAAAAPIGITEVYSAGTFVNPANYAITFEDGGRTYITFTATQSDNKITFNCTGYSLPAWDDATSGYIQNPAYVLGFYLIYLCNVPINFVDIASLDVLAQQFKDTGYGTIGRLALTVNKDADAYLKELLFSFGIKMWPDMRGRFTFGRKEIGDIATDVHIFAQIDTQDAPERPYNLRGAINYAKARWDFHPAAALWDGAGEQVRQPAVDDYGERHEAPWDYPWIADATFAAQRMNEDLIRLAYGHRTVKFQLPLEFIADIEIFDNIQLQDQFDIHPTGGGSQGHYYYVTSLEYDFQNQKLNVEAEDLQWLMGQCMVIGKYAELNRNYNNATPWQRGFAYIGRCIEGTFANGDPNKKICKCN